MKAASLPNVLVAQIGARRHYAIPSVLAQAGMLSALYTDLCASWPPVRFLDRILPSRLQPRLLRSIAGRRPDQIPGKKIHCFPGFGLKRLLMRRRQADPGARRAMYVRANQNFGRCCTRKGLNDATAVYAYNGASLEIFKQAREQGMKTLLDQTSAPVVFEETLMAEEREAWPDWESTRSIQSAWQAMAEREAQEWALADRIFCGSAFVRDCLIAQGVDAAILRVNEYGIDPRFFSADSPPPDRKILRVLYAGGVRLQKGMPYLMEAARLLRDEDIEFRLVGPVLLEAKGRAALETICTLAGPVDRARMIEEYRAADLFVFPSLCEGSANVCYEALAMGVPVITTPHAGSIVRDGVDGFIVPIRSGEALAEKIRLLAGDAERRSQMAEAARTRARAFTWEAYGARLVDELQELGA